MTVAQLVSHFEAIHEDHTSVAEHLHSSSLRTPHPSSLSSSKVRLSLQTWFGHNGPLRRSLPKRSDSNNMSSSTSSSSLRSSSPSASFTSTFGGRAGHRLHIRPVDLHNNNHQMTSCIRRQPSAIDLALEEERYADPVEIIGLGFLEPRPRANTFSSTTSAASSSSVSSPASASPQCSWMEFMNESVQTPVVLDGIFEVLERA